MRTTRYDYRKKKGQRSLQNLLEPTGILAQRDYGLHEPTVCHYAQRSTSVGGRVEFSKAMTIRLVTFRQFVHQSINARSDSAALPDQQSRIPVQAIDECKQEISRTTFPSHQIRQDVSNLIVIISLLGSNQPFPEVNVVWILN